VWGGGGNGAAMKMSESGSAEFQGLSGKIADSGYGLLLDPSYHLPRLYDGRSAVLRLGMLGIRRLCLLLFLDGSSSDLRRVEVMPGLS